jgi:hypothetical protein
MAASGDRLRWNEIPAPIRAEIEQVDRLHRRHRVELPGWLLGRGAAGVFGDANHLSLGGFHHTPSAGRLPGMSLRDDLDYTAVTAAVHALAADLPEISAGRLERAAAHAVAAVRPYLDGIEYTRITADADHRLL